MWAVVTGASDGIGREIAIVLAEAKLNVVLAARRGALLETLGAELRRASGVETLVVAADLSTGAGVATLLDATRHTASACSWRQPAMAPPDRSSRVRSTMNSR